MKTKNRFIALTLAVAINAAALAALHIAMVESAERAQAANIEAEYVVVTAPRAPADLAHNNCPAKAL